MYNLNVAYMQKFCENRYRNSAGLGFELFFVNPGLTGWIH